MSRRRADVWGDRLGRTPVFSALDASTRAQLAAAATRRTLRRGRYLFHEGERADSVAFVLSGRLDIVRDMEDGRAMLIRSLCPDALVGLSTIAGSAHSAGVRAGEASEVLVIPGSELRGVVARDPTVALRCVSHLAGLLATLTDEVEELRSHDLDERLRRRLLRLAAGTSEVRVTHSELAASAGATRANVSRALKRLEQRGFLRRHRGRIEMLI